jgi:ABC-2 type transport system ATP-binding protein
VTGDGRPAIEVSGLHKSFRRHRVLDGVTLQVGVGERVALVGANGAGKTTLIRCLLGEYVFDGTARVAGLDPRLQRRAALSRLGFVPQTPPPLRQTVGQLLRFAAAICGCGTSPIERVSERLGLDPRAIWRQPFAKLSGGQKQKLLIAIALGRAAGVLIMDEPAANLDPEARRIFFDLLAERADANTMLLSSHRLDEVSGLVNRVVELDAGRVVLDDRLADAQALTTQLSCRLVLRRGEQAVTIALKEWGLRDLGDGLRWQGTVSGADRLRFLGMLSRYSGLVAELALEQAPDELGDG